MKKAFTSRRSGRPGPVVVDIPKDVRAFNKAPTRAIPRQSPCAATNPVRKGHGGQIRKALRLMLMSAKRPVHLHRRRRMPGNAAQELRELVDMTGFPVTHHADGPGRLSADRPLKVPRHARHARHGRGQLRDAELRRAAGCRRALRRPRHRQPEAFRPVERKIIHIDIDPSSIAKRVKVDVPIVGDVKDVLGELIGMIRESQQRGRPAEAHPPGGTRSRAGAPTDCLAYDRGNTEVTSRRRPWSIALWNRPGTTTATSVRTSASTRCGRPSFPFAEPRRWINSAAAWAPWAGPAGRDGLKLAAGRQLVHHRRGLDPDEHPGAVDLPAVRHPGQDRLNLNNRYPAWCGSGRNWFIQGRYSHSYMDAIPTSSRSPRPSAMSAC